MNMNKFKLHPNLVEHTDRLLSIAEERNVEDLFVVDLKDDVFDRAAAIETIIDVYQEAKIEADDDDGNNAPGLKECGIFFKDD